MEYRLPNPIWVILLVMGFILFLILHPPPTPPKVKKPTTARVVLIRHAIPISDRDTFDLQLGSALSIGDIAFIVTDIK